MKLRREQAIEKMEEQQSWIEESAKKEGEAVVKIVPKQLKCKKINTTHKIKNKVEEWTSSWKW